MRRLFTTAALHETFGGEAACEARKLLTRQKGKAGVCRATLGPVR